MTERTDRELLELAAKALGWRVVSYSERRSTGVVDGGMALVVAEGRTFGWSPLHNDADTFRLMVKLNIQPDFYRDHLKTSYYPDGSFYLAGGVQISPEMPYGSDKEAATRRAIVDAAAEIGAKP